MQFTSKNLALLAAAASLTNALPTSQVKRDFDAGANNNVAVWWGNSNVLTPLSTICKSSSQDIVILTFAEYASGKWSEAGNVATADDIKACQSAGKKVFMSIGGGTGTIAFSSDDDAKTAADGAFSAYLDASGHLGVALDGIDLDLENREPAHWDTFVKEIRGKMSKTQYLSAAPQCPSPDASIPFNVLNLLDFVWVQFYNNGDCNHGASGFDASVKDWSSKLTGPKFYIGAPGSTGSAGSGYLAPDALTKEVADVKAMNLANFGGYAFWDASTAYSNSDYAGVAKKALGGNSGSSTPSKPSAAPSAPATTSPAATGKGGQGSDGTTTVQATSTAVVTSTAFATGAATTATTPAAAAPAAPSGSSSGTSCSADGTIVCSADGKKFGVCYGGSATMMAVSAGTTCSNGQIGASS